MKSSSGDVIRQVTSELNDEVLRELLNTSQKTIEYHSVPHAKNGAGVHFVWRVRLELAFDSNVCIGLDINGEVTLGRERGILDLGAFLTSDELEQMGVSRHHVRLRPTNTKLYVLDEGSTNGTRLNGQPIGVNTPYSLSDGDHLMIGRLELIVRIIQQPRGNTTVLQAKADLADSCIPIAKAITTQLDREGVLSRALEMVTSFTSAGEAAIWLIDEISNELFVGAVYEQSKGQGNSFTNALANEIVDSGKFLQINHLNRQEYSQSNEDLISKAVMYAPVILGGTTLGALAAIHHKEKEIFSKQEESLFLMIADFTAIALQNARHYQANTRALNRKTRAISAFNYTLTYNLKSLAKSTIGYIDWLARYEAPSEEIAEIVEQIAFTGNRTAHIVDLLIEVIMLQEGWVTDQSSCDLAEITTKAISNLKNAADSKSIKVNFQQAGKPYKIQSNAGHLYRSILTLIDHAIRYSPPQEVVLVSLEFQHNDVVIQIQDRETSIFENDFPYFFGRTPQEQYSLDEQTEVGLGLELVQAMVEASQGVLIARNMENQGVEFIITLPGTLRTL